MPSFTPGRIRSTKDASPPSAVSTPLVTIATRAEALEERVAVLREVARELVDEVGELVRVTLAEGVPGSGFTGA